MISIIVPVYNASKYLEDCILSVLKQTYKDFELILIDDGSKDNSLDILKRFETFDKRIKIYEQKNHGVSYTRNKGIDLAKGDYILFLDSDDWIESDMLEQMYSAMIKTNVSVVRCNYFVNNLQEQYVGNDFFEEKEVTYNKKEIKDKIIPALLSNKMKSFSVLYLIDSKVLKGKIYYNEEISMLEDQIFCLKMLSKIDKITFIHNPLYHYRVNESSVTVKVECIKNNIENILMVNEIISDFLRQNQYADRYIKILNQCHLNLIIKQFYRLHENGLLDVRYLEKIRNLVAMKNILKEYDLELEESRKLKICVLLFKHKTYTLFLLIFESKKFLNNFIFRRKNGRK